MKPVARKLNADRNNMNGHHFKQTKKMVRKQSSYLSDIEISCDEIKLPTVVKVLTEADESDDGSCGSLTQEEIMGFRNKALPKLNNSSVSAHSVVTADTYEHSDLISSMKKKRQLYYQPTMELSPMDRSIYYANIAANTANHRADRTLKKCQDTLDRLEVMQAKNKHVRSSSLCIAE